jgi:GxxExxY protein
MTQNDVDRLSYLIIGSAINVHRELGPGLTEYFYHQCLLEDLKVHGCTVESERKIKLQYHTKSLEAEVRCDMIVNNLIILELKATDKLLPIHQAQLLSYMRLLKKPKGILINFRCTNISKEGQKTYVNEYYSRLPKG